MDEPMPERWLPVPGYEGLYEVSDLGRVWSIPRIDAINRRRGGFYLTPGFANGYPFYRFSLNGIARTWKTHRLVAHVFLGPCPPGLQVRHLDGDRGRPEVGNLAYGTASENNYDTVNHGRNPSANRTQCPAGHQYNAENTYTYQRRGGKTNRICKLCQRERSNAWKRKVGYK